MFVLHFVMVQYIMGHLVLHHNYMVLHYNSIKYSITTVLCYTSTVRIISQFTIRLTKYCGLLFFVGTNFRGLMKIKHSWGSEFVVIVLSFIFHTANCHLVGIGNRGWDPPRKPRKLVPHKNWAIHSIYSYWFTVFCCSWDTLFPSKSLWTIKHSNEIFMYVLSQLYRKLVYPQKFSLE